MINGCFPFTMQEAKQAATGAKEVQPTVALHMRQHKQTHTDTLIPVKRKPPLREKEEQENLYTFSLNRLINVYTAPASLAYFYLDSGEG